MDIAFRVLGPAEIVVDGLPAALQGRRTRGLLAALLLHEGRVVPAAELIALIWDGDAPKTAANQLQIAVHRLRAALSAAGLDGRLGTRDGGYALDLPAGTRVDLHDFRVLASEAADRAAAGDWAAARDTGRAALALWRGPAWGGLGADGPRRAAETERLTVVELVQAAALVLGERAAPVAELRALVAENPYHQRFWYLLILALALRGRPAEALETHAAARERHQRELGTGLGPELAELERAVLRGELRDAVDAVRGWASERATAAAPASPGGLPADIADFTGRAAEGDHVAGILRANPAHRDPAVVVIAGLGGIGKTTFAVRTAHRNAGLFPDGCLFVDLRGFDDTPKETHAVMGDLLHALGVGGQAVPDDPDARLGVYRSVMSGRQVLLVLDNAASEAQVRPLLPVHAASAALVTSRRLLAGLDGAFVVELDVLSPPEALGMLTGIHRDGGRRTDPVALDRIAELTGRHPLALRILGSRTARMCVGDLGEVLSRLSDEKARLDELSDGDGRVRQSIGFGYTDLEPTAARLLRLAAQLPTPRFSAEIASGLLGTDVFDAEEALDELVDAQLLRPVEGAVGVRYVMHDLVRLYAREQGERDEGALGAAYGLLLALAHHADDVLGYRYFPTPPLPDWAPEAHPESLAAIESDPLGWFEEERELLFAMAAEAGPEGWHLASRLANMIDLRALLHPGARLFDEVLAATEDDHGTALLLLARARVHGVVAEYRPGLRALIRAWRLFQRLDDPVRSASAAALASPMLRLLRRISWALHCGEWAVTALAGLDQDDVTVRAQLGWALQYRGEYELYHGESSTALELLGRAVAAMVSAGDRAGEGFGRSGMSLAALRCDDVEACIRHGERSVAILAASGSRSDEAQARVFLAGGYLRAGRIGEAREAVTSAITVLRRLHRPSAMHIALTRLGMLEQSEAQYGEALAAYREAADLAGAHRLLVARANALLGVARAHTALRQWDAARRSAREALAIYESEGRGTEEAVAVLAELPTGSS